MRRFIGHVDKINGNQATQSAQTNLLRQRGGGFQINRQSIALGTARIDINRGHRLGRLNHQPSTRWQVNTRRHRPIQLTGDIMAVE